MNWQEASVLIVATIKKGMDVNSKRSTFRTVEEIPPYQCKKYNYNNEAGYKVRMGGINYVEVPISMLERIFNEAVKNNRVYNNEIFTSLFSQQAKDHGCHEHVVGRIFEVSGVATSSGTNYTIL